MMLGLITGCSSSSDADTVQIGPARTDYKESPCKRKIAWLGGSGVDGPIDSAGVDCRPMPQDAPPGHEEWRRMMGGA
ncbi:hypothetical protein [Azospirillum sp. B4]|uniref:hypothetical protein n=1 Tax=Azospirillum sp. B4 TaxID=95605 RepID=UPI0011DCDEFA|nr:hypothetical protein [Azospirillum sp. B4]